VEQKGISCESPVDFDDDVHRWENVPHMEAEQMLELWPRGGEALDVVARYEADARSKPDGSPWLLLSMISSLDGAAAVAGVSGGLGAPADRAVFLALRGLADAIVVAAGTARAENYGRPMPTPKVRMARVERHQTPAPRIAVITGSLALDPESRLFTEIPPGGEEDERPIIFTTENADPARVAALSDVAEIRRVGSERVEMSRVTESLGIDGAKVILAEGGPSLNGQILAEDLIDELCLSVAPTLVGGSEGRIFTSAAESSHDMRLDRVGMGDGLLLLRYVRAD
jgi:riboflavin biosynthesis pyrimidine reductase